MTAKPKANAPHLLSDLMPRYVVLYHRVPDEACEASLLQRGSHWDFMLEDGASLRTWALGKEPWCGGQLAVHALPAHRLTYLHYEGPISQNRGSVQRVDSGEFDWRCDRADSVQIQICGPKLSGLVIFAREDDDRWIYEYQSDR